jgi:hypothetical protein
MAMLQSWAQRVLFAGFVAAVGSTLAQFGFMLSDRRRWPVILMRDSRMAAAVVLGREALAERRLPLRVLVAAASIHFLVASLDAATLALAMTRRGARHLPSLPLGAAYGLAAYGVRVHLLAPLYPWMRELQTPAYLLTHIAHGIVTALALRSADPDSARPGDREISDRPSGRP